MIDVAKHVREVFKDELNKLKLGDTVGFAVDGPSYVASPQGVTVGWLLLVTLKHNILIGQPDIGVTVPLVGVMPPDEFFRKGAALVLEEARKLRHEMSQKPPDDGALQGNVIPPGLLKGLGGSASLNSGSG